MGTRKPRTVPARLASLQRRFEQWRQTHRPRSRIPDSLWAAAVKMASRYGLCRTARALPVEYYLLKKHVERHSPTALRRQESDPPPSFVELPPPVPTGECDCTLELEDTRGAKMRVHLKAAVPFRGPVPAVMLRVRNRQ
jgi:hypothetical protein